MTLPIKSILSCLLILAAAPDIHTQQIQKSGQQTVIAKLPHGMISVWGRGVKQGQLPIILYSPNPLNFRVSIYIQPQKQCDFTFSTRGDHPAIINAVKQLGGNIIVFAWTQLVITRGKSTVITSIPIIDMDGCSNKKTVEYTWHLTSKLFLEVVPFDNSFDVITSENSHASYDANGNLIGKIESFPINSYHFSVTPVSTTSPTNNGFFIADYVHAALNLVKVDGKSLKPLLKPIPVQVFSNSEQGLYSVCFFDAHLKNVVNCYQYNNRGDEMWRNKASLGFPDGERMDVKNLPDGGLVLAALNAPADQLCIAQMGPKQTHTWFMKSNFANVRLMEFNEKEHTFLMAYETIQKNHGVFDYTIALQEYSLVSPKLN